MSNVLAQIVNAGALNNFSKRLEKGEHLVALFFTELKQVHDKQINDKVNMVTAEFVVVQSTVHPVGERRSDAWFVGRQGSPGEYARKRCNAFGQAVTQSIGGDPAKIVDVQANLGKTLEIDEATGYTKAAGRRFPGRGILLRVSTSEQPDKKKADKVHLNQEYTAITQTAEEIVAMRARIEAMPDPSAKPQGAQPNPAATVSNNQPTTTAAPEAAAPSMLDMI